MTAAALAAAAAQSTVWGVFQHVAVRYRAQTAIRDGETSRSYAELAQRVRQTADALHRLDRHGTGRFAILAENRAEYLEAQLAAARLGGCIACLNWRLTPGEMQHCLDLFQPGVLLVSPRHAGLAQAVRSTAEVAEFGPAWEQLLQQPGTPSPEQPGAELPWLVLYTGGTTGLPKGAVIPQRATLARMFAMEADLGLQPGDPCLAWPPMFHMGGTEPALHALLTGGEVLVEPGFDPARLAAWLTRRDFGWISIQPGMVPALIAALEAEERPRRQVRHCGVMPDLVPVPQIARLTALLGATYRNTFGSTETGTPPLSGAPVTIVDGAADLAKAPSAFVELRLVDAQGQDVAEGEVGEMAMRGPTLFSFYWRDPTATVRDFRDGWFHMGDLFSRRADGRYVFAGRSKYMIKSGGENIYPAEIERVLLAHPGVIDAVVIGQSDRRWGETPVALVAAAEAVTTATLAALCRSQLAGYKQPRRILLVPPDRLARTQTGKLPRAALEAWLQEQERIGKS